MGARTWLAAAVVAAVACPAALHAVGGTITDEDVSFVRTSFGTDPAVKLTGVSSTLTENNLYQFGWWFRVAGDTEETPFLDPDIESYVGDLSNLTWNDLGGRGLVKALEAVTVVDTGFTPSGYLLIYLTLINLSESPLQVELFNYADFDVAGAANDSAAFAEKTPSEIIDLADAGGDFAQYQAVVTPYIAPNKIHHRVTAFSTLRSLLNDDSVTNLDNSGLPFGPGDFTGAYQFSVDLPAHGSALNALYLYVNKRTYCKSLIGIFCDGFEIGNESLWGP